MATWDDVRRIALDLPEVTEQASHDQPAWRVAGKLFVWERPLRKSDIEALGPDAPAGLVMQAAGLAWLALITAPGVAYTSFILPFVISGVGMALFFVPVANTVLGSVRPDQEGIASGANNAIRELGGVFGIAVLASVFSAQGSYTSGTSFAHGLDAAVWVGAAIVAAAAAAAVVIPRRRARLAARSREEIFPETAAAEPAVTGTAATEAEAVNVAVLPVAE